MLLLIARTRIRAVRYRARTDMSILGRRRRDRRITRRALLSPSMSAFMHLFGSGCYQSLITTCGLDHSAFRLLLEKFEPFYNRFSPYSDNGAVRRLPSLSVGGRPRSMSALQALALYLAWTRSRGAESSLCLIFGVTGTVCSLFVRFARRILVQVLMNDSVAKIVMPGESDVNLFAETFERRYTSLKRYIV